MFLKLSLLFFCAKAIADPCVTKSGINGDCKPIIDCDSLLTLYSPPLTHKTAEILRSYHCGFAGRIAKVCCPPTLTKYSESLLPQVCGNSLGSKIYGGEKTELDEFPWMALLQYQLKNGTKIFNCGGVLISKRYVLTAAHCINPKLVSVRLGEYDTTTEIDCIVNTLGKQCSSPPLNLQIEDTITNEGYLRNEFNQYHDIALIRLAQDVTFNDYIQPICLPNSTHEFTKSYLTERLFVAGWGRTENNTVSSQKLKVQIPVQERSFCERMYKKYNYNLTLSESQLCAGGETGRDSCTGDSGGSLMNLRNDYDTIQWYAVGVVSFGPKPCGMPNWGGVYTRASKYVNWIRSKLKP